MACASGVAAAVHRQSRRAPPRLPQAILRSRRRCGAQTPEPGRFVDTDFRFFDEAENVVCGRKAAGIKRQRELVTIWVWLSYAPNTIVAWVRSVHKIFLVKINVKLVKCPQKNPCLACRELQSQDRQVDSRRPPHLQQLVHTRVFF